MASVRHQFSVAIADDPTAQANGEVLPSHWNQGHTLSGVATQTSLDAVSQAVSVVSHALSVLSQQNSVEHAALSVRIDLGGGTASVTSNELSAVSQNASANAVSIRDNVSAVSAATSVKGLQSVINQISNRTSVLSQAVSVISQQVSALSQSLSVLSNTNSSEHAALSLRVTSAFNAISVTSNEVSAVSQNASANAVSIANVVSNNASVNDVSIWNAVSAIRSTASVRSVGDVSTHGHQSILNALSTRISHAMSVMSLVSQTASANAVSIGNVVSNNASANAVSIRNAQSIGGHTNVSIGSPTSAQVLKYKSVSAQWINDTDATGGAGGSVTSAEVSVVSQNASANAVSIVNAKLSTLSFTYSAVSVKGAQSVLNQIASVISNAVSAGSVISSDVTSIKNVISAKLPWAAARVFTISNLQSIAASALTDISGLVLTVAADETWKFDGMLLVHVSGSNTAGLRVGFSVPPLSTPRFAVFDAISAPTQSAPGMRAAGQLQVSGASVILSLTSSQFAAAGSAIPVNFEGIFNVTSAGTFRVMAAVVASATQAPVHINGGYMMAYRLK